MNEEVLKSFKELLVEAEEKYNDEVSKIQKDADLFEKGFSRFDDWAHSGYFNPSSALEYYEKHKNDIILAYVSRKLQVFVSSFIISHRNWEGKSDEFKKYAGIEKYEDFYNKALNGALISYGGNFEGNVISSEYENVRNFIKKIFPTGEEIEIKELYAHDRDESTKVDEFIIQIYDKVLGKSKYNYVTKESQRRSNTELYNNPNLSMEEWASLKAKQTIACFYQGGVFTSEHGYQYPDTNRFDFENFQNNPEKFKSEYESWQRTMKMREEEKSGRSK